MSDGRTGDRVNWADDQRADKPDLDDVAKLNETALVRTAGGFMGSASGCIIIPTMAYVSGGNAGIWSVSDFLAWEGSSRTTSPSVMRDGRVLRHDSSKSWQSSLTLDFTGYTTAGPVGWVRRVEFPLQDEDARKRWLSGSEQAFAHKTRTREGVELSVSQSINHAPVAGGTGWIPFCYISNYSTGGAAVVITPITVWDGVGNYDGQSTASFTTGGVTNAMSNVADGGFDSAGTVLGLATLLQSIRAFMGRIQDNTGATNWATIPGRGLSQLHTDLTAAEGDIDDLEARNTADVAITIGCGYIDEAGGSYSVNAAAVGLASVAKNGTGDVTVTPTIPSGYTLIGAQVTLADPGTAEGVSVKAERDGNDIDVSMYSDTVAPTGYRDEKFFITVMAKPT